MKKAQTLMVLCLISFALFFGNACKKSTTPSDPLQKSTGINGDIQDNQIKAGGTADTVKAESQPAETQATSPAPEKNAAGNCVYQTDPKTIQLEWTAYKFTEKTPVKGTFKTTQVEGPNEAKTLAILVKGLHMSIDGATIDSGDPGRNTTIKQFFFNKFNPPFKLIAAVKALEGNDLSGNLTIAIDMNGIVKEIPFRYTVSPDGELVAKSGINLMNWQLKAAFDSIHKACKQLHTGKDGVSKTWDVVDLKLSGKFTKTCTETTN